MRKLLQLPITLSTCGNEDCSVSVKELRKGYLTEMFGVPGYEFMTDRDDYPFKYTETVSIDFLKLKGYSEDQDKWIFDDTLVDPRETTDHSFAILDIDVDGWYQIQHFVIPKLQWFTDNETELNAEEFLSYTLFLYDGTNNLFIKKVYETNKWKTKYSYTLNEFLELLTTSYIGYPSKIEKSNLSYGMSNYFTSCFLTHCYISISNKLLLQVTKFGACAKPDSYTLRDLIKRRDIAWMSLNVIKFHIENEHYEEANKIIKMLSDCNGVCGSEFQDNSDHKCGCSKK